IVPGSLGCASAVLAAMATLAPSRAARSAMARPMPRLAPVTKRVLPESDIVSAPITWKVGSGHLEQGFKAHGRPSDLLRRTALGCGLIPVDTVRISRARGLAAGHQAV